MKCDNLSKWDTFPYHLQNPNGRMLATAAYLLKYHGHTHLAKELNELAADLLAIPPHDFGVNT